MTIKGKSEKIANKITKKRFSVLQVCKTITFIAFVVSFVITQYIIQEQRNQVEMLRDYNTILENRNQTCFNKWADLTEQGKLIQTLEIVEGPLLNLD